MTHPNVTFRKSTAKDLTTIQTFTKESVYDNGRNLNWAAFKKYPKLKKYFDNNKGYKINNIKALRNFIDKTYHIKQAKMDHALERHGKRWTEIAPVFFSLVDPLFHGRKWPRGKYIAFGTIWGMYPRFLEDKTFQIPFWHRSQKYISVVIAHELLHFMFYDYFYERYPKYNRPKYNFFVWQISEIFNTIIQNSPTWLSHFKLKSMGYPEHRKIVKKISRPIYRRNTFEIDELVDEIVKNARYLSP
jgi:hypothetical protein